MSAVIVEKSIDCASDAEALWRVVSDTERINRAVGLGALELEPLNGESSARYLVSTVSGGFPLVYEELPFEWVENRRFVVKRVVRRGMVQSLVNEFELAPLEAGSTRVTVRITVDPNLPLLAPVIRVQVKRFVERICREIARRDAELVQGHAPKSQGRVAHVDVAPLERAASALRQRVAEPDRALVERLVEHVSGSSDADVSRIRPFELADVWRADRRRVLALFLEGVRAGLLELRWDLVCPSCRTASDSTPSLKDLPANGHCQLCDISFDLELDRAVEATFAPARGLRSIDAGPYCIGGPARTPHVYAQALIGAGAEILLSAPLHEASYRLFARGGAAASIGVVAHSPERITVELDRDRFSPSTLDVAPGGEVRVVQRGGSERHVKIERLDYRSGAATAHFISTLPQFRREFTSDVLRPGMSLRVARVSLLFSDLTDSTALYTAVGDAGAFSVVQEHFVLLQDIVERHDGVVVKTIGDAVMAAFIRESDAVRAAIAMHSAFPGFRDSHANARHNYLKVGVFAGPCYVVTANGILDYFGQSVNTAARLQSAARAGELVLNEELAREAERAGWLGQLAVSERFEAVLKGLSEPIRAARIVADASAR
jgi:class 3 adenylate cyclase